MANIPTYDAPERDVFRPNESGASVVARQGARIGAMAREGANLTLRASAAVQRGLSQLGIGVEKVGKLVEDHQASTEISNGTRALADLHNSLDAQWATTRDQLDPSMAAGPNFLDKTVKPALQKLADGAVTKRGREHMLAVTDNALLHYTQSTHSDDMAAAGDNVVRNMKTTIDTATRRSAQDMTTVGYNGDLIKQAFDGAIKSGSFDTKTTIALRKEQDAALRENVHSGIIGAINRNPFQAEKDLDKWAQTYNIGGKELEAFQQHVKMQKHAKITEANAAAVSADIATHKQSQAYFQKMMNDWKTDANGEVTGMPKAGDVLHDKNMTVPDRLELYRFIQSYSKQGPVKDNMEVYNDLKSNIGNTKRPTSPEAVAKMVDSRDIRPETGKQLLDDIITHKGDRELGAIFKDVKQADGSMKWPTVAEIMAGDAKLETKERAVNFVDKMTKAQDAPENFSSYSELRTGIGADRDPTTAKKINDYIDAHKISVAEGRKLLDMVVNEPKTGEEKRWNAGVKEMVKTVREGLKLDGAQAFAPGAPYAANAAAHRMDELAQSARQNGVKLEELNDPTSKNYFMRDPLMQDILGNVNRYDPKNVGKLPVTRSNTGRAPVNPAEKADQELDKDVDKFGLGKKK